MTEQKKRWLYAFGWVALIYSTLSVVRPVCSFLRARLPFAPVVNTTLVLVFALLILILIKKFRLRLVSSYLFMAMIGAVYAYGLFALKIPEEKIHFIQYGVMAYLFYRAMQFSTGGWRLYALAFVVTALIGWGDEGIQYLLPSRYYDVRDVVVNAISGALALMIVAVVRRERLLSGTRQSG